MNEKRNFSGGAIQVVFRLAFIAVAAGATTGCDPIVNVYGSFLPAWVICIVIGIVVTVLLQLVFAASGLRATLVRSCWFVRRLFFSSLV